MSMMLLLLSGALAGELLVEVKVPARIALDGELVAEVYREGSLRLPVQEGAHRLVITTNGDPRPYEVHVGAEPLVVLVGRAGVTVGASQGAPLPAAIPVLASVSDVRFRTVTNERLLVQVGKQRVLVPPGKGIVLPLGVGEHPLSVRSADGTSVFAKGVLTVSGGADPVVQITEGALPETAGGVAFRAVGN